MFNLFKNKKMWNSIDESINRHIPFTTKQQIYILKKTLSSKGLKYGICSVIAGVCGIDVINISFFIPLFTKQNADLYGHTTGTIWWWSYGELKPRKDFIKWMINELKKEK